MSSSSLSMLRLTIEICNCV